MKKSYLKEYTRYVSVNIFAMIFLSLYILIDTFFISNRLGTNGFAALNLILPIYNLMHGCGLMVGIGGAAKYSIFKAQENDDEKITFTNSVYTALGFALIFFIAGEFFYVPLSKVMGADEILLPMTSIYIRVLLFFAPAFLLNNVLISYVRNDGAPKLCTAAIITGSFVNVLFDYIFMYPMNMGMFGAALATGMSPVSSIAVLSVYFIRKKNNFKFLRKKPEMKLIFSQLSLGFSSLVSEVSSGVAIVIFNLIFLKFEGNVGIAAYGVVANWALVLVAIYNGLAQGAQPLFSKAYGQGDYKTLRLYLKYSFVLIVGLFAVIYSFVSVFVTPLTGVFNSEHNAKLQEIGELGLRLYFLAAPFIGGNILLAIYFAAVDRAVPSQIIAILRGFVIIIPTAFIMAAVGGVTGVFLTFVITESIVFIMGITIGHITGSRT